MSPAAETYNDSVKVTVAHDLYWRAGGLRYTTDGTAPTPASPVYAGPFWVNGNTTVRAAQFDAAGKSGPEAKASFEVNDVTPPTVASASATTISASATVVFSEPVTAESARAASNYTFDPPDQVKSAALDADGTTVRLTLAAPVAAGARLSVAGVRDASPAGNASRPSPVQVNLTGPVFTLDQYTCDGKKTKEIPAPGLPVAAGDSWTINVFVRTDEQPDNRTLIAGFGRSGTGEEGGGRYLAKFVEGVHFWSENRDVATKTPLDVGKWQMLSAVYDGKTLRVYKNAEPVGEGEIALAGDEPTVRLAPVDPWDKRRRFRGELRAFTVWAAPLTPGRSRRCWRPARNRGKPRRPRRGGTHGRGDATRPPPPGRKGAGVSPFRRRPAARMRLRENRFSRRRKRAAGRPTTIVCHRTPRPTRGNHSRPMTRRAVLCSFAWAAALLAPAVPCGAHPSRSVEAVARVGRDGRFELSARFDALAFALNETPDRTPDAPMNALLDGPPAELRRLMDDSRERFTGEFSVTCGDAAAAVDAIHFPTADDVCRSRDAGGSARLPLLLDATVAGRLPAGAASVAFRFPGVLGEVVLTVERPGEEPYSQPVEPGDASTPLSLDLNAPLPEGAEPQTTAPPTAESPAASLPVAASPVAAAAAPPVSRVRPTPGLTRLGTRLPAILLGSGRGVPA